MKLPEEFSHEYDLRGMSHVQRLVEAIVRDCAKVCIDIGEQYADGRRHALERAAYAILIRYGLEEKK